MRKNKKKMLLFLITCLSMVQISCTFEEKFITENNNSKNYQLFEKKFSDIIKEKEFKSSFSKVAKPNFNGSSKTIMEQQYGFEIDETAIVKEIHQNGVITYTLGIKTDSLHNNQLRNLYVEQSENNEVSAYILSYHLTAPLLPTGHNSFSLNYSTATIEPINYNANQASRVLLSDGCYMSNVLMCCEPWISGQNGVLHVAGHDCDEAAFLSMQSVIDCSGGGGGGSGANNGNGGGTGGGAPADGGSASGGPTSPTSGGLGDIEDEDTPCARLKRLFHTSKGNIKQYFPALFNGIPSNPNGEDGVSLTKNSSGVYNNIVLPTSTIGSIPIKSGTIKYCAIHTHNKSQYPMFSIGDLVVLHGLINNSSSYNITDVSFMLACIDDNNVNQLYAITYDNIAQFNQFYESIMQSVSNWSVLTELGKVHELDKVFKEHLEAEDLNVNPDFEKTFLKYINNSGVSLFKANTTMTNWSKISISTSQTNFTGPLNIDKNILPCN